jgi:hypothetical protein
VFIYVKKVNKELCIRIKMGIDPNPNPRAQEYADPDPGAPKLQIQCGSGSEILDFQVKDPDPKLLISDPEHCFL